MSEFFTVNNGMGLTNNIVPGAPVIKPPDPPVVRTSGFALPTQDLADFELVYIEDFNRDVAESVLTTNGAASAFDKIYNVQPNNDLSGGQKVLLGSYPSTYDDTSNKGRYGTAICSVANSVMTARIRTEAGWPRVVALNPRLGNFIPGLPYGASNVLGGAMEMVWSIDVIDGYKFVPLMWPYSNTRTTVDGVHADGEIDFPEISLDPAVKIGGWMHWQGDVKEVAPTPSHTDQTGFSSTIVGPGGGWRRTRTEWIPGTLSGIKSTGGRCDFWAGTTDADMTRIKRITGSTDGTTGPFIPVNAMHWVIQQETELGSTIPPTTSTGLLKIDYIAFYRWKGTMTP